MGKYLIDEKVRALPPLPGTPDDEMEPNYRMICVQAARPAGYNTRIRKSNDYRAPIMTSLAAVDTFK